MRLQREIKKITREVSVLAGVITDPGHFQNTGGLSGILLRVKDSIREIEKLPEAPPGSFEKADLRDELMRIAALAVSAVVYTDTEEEIREVASDGVATLYADEYAKLFNLVADVFAKGDRESLGVLNEYYKEKLENGLEEEVHEE